MPNEMRYGVSLLSEHDIYLFRQGSHFRLHDKLGAHPMNAAGTEGTLFSVWAPNAERVHVIGSFNDWQPGVHVLKVRADGSGIWEGFVPGASVGDAYKFRIESNVAGFRVDKADPYARWCEAPPRTASRVWRDSYQWRDADWMRTRHEHNALDAPISIYELHLGSWRRNPEEGNRPLTYRELAQWLPQHVRYLGFTHVEFMPVMEHPFYGSWGYQCTAYFAPTARYGTPEELKYLIDELHLHGIGVILDWVPSHFPDDEHGLVFFDGTHLYEHADRRQGFHPEWKSWIFNYGRHEVRAFLGSSALFWLGEFHADGLRIDAVASMLYLDYGRKQSEWIPNRYGGKENLEAITCLRALNEAVYRDYPDVHTFAEESTAWPMVSRPTSVGGLGFGFKWNMGWMHDTLHYMQTDPIYRKYHHNEITFGIWYAFTENFVLPLSHDEVVYGKGSLLARMPGDTAQKLASLRLLYGYMWTHPGKKLLFMGGELGQYNEWHHETSLDWHLLTIPGHHGVMDWLRDMNAYMRKCAPLNARDFSNEGFQWIDHGDAEQSMLVYLRLARGKSVAVVCNFTPVLRTNYRFGVPEAGYWREALNSDATLYGGAGHGNLGGVESAPVPAHGHYHSLVVAVPPLACVIFESPSLAGGAA